MRVKKLHVLGMFGEGTGLGPRRREKGEGEGGKVAERGLSQLRGP